MAPALGKAHRSRRRNLAARACLTCPPCRQAQAIPSYLLALAVGNLESRRLGPISHVWSEPEMVEAGAYEFAGAGGGGGWVCVACGVGWGEEECRLGDILGSEGGWTDDAPRGCYGRK